MPGCRPLTDLEITEVMQLLGLGRYGIRDLTLFILGLKTGYRISELLSLKVSDLYQHGEIVTHITIDKSRMKGGKESRTVKLNTVAAAAIDKLVKETNLFDDDYLFKSRFGGPLSRIQAWRILRGVFTQLKLKGKVATHSMRKTNLGKVWKATKHDPYKSIKWSGHKKIETFFKYLQTTQSELDELAEQI